MIDRFQAMHEDFRRYAKDGTYFLLISSILILFYIYTEGAISYQIITGASIFSIILVTLNELNNPARQHAFLIIQVIAAIIAITIYAYAPAPAGSLINKANLVAPVLFFSGLYGFYLKIIYKPK